MLLQLLVSSMLLCRDIGRPEPGSSSPALRMVIHDSIHPRRDFREVFTELEVAAAFRLMSQKPGEAEELAAQLYAEKNEPWVPMEDLFSALSLLSADAADRVRLMLAETKQQEQRRVEAFRQKLERRQGGQDPFGLD